MELYDITKYYKHHGLVGEANIAIVMTLISILGKAIGFGIEASAGSGKTVMMNICYGLPEKDNGLIDQRHIYFKDGGSATSMAYDFEKINKAKILVLSELQKDQSHNSIETIKSLTEGKAANYKVTDVTKKEVVEKKIEPLTVIYSLATENDTKPDTELKRRFITMSTDISQEQTNKVVVEKSKYRWDTESFKILTEDEQKELKRHVNKLILFKPKIANPYAEPYSHIITKFAPDQKVRSMSEHFWDLVEAITKFRLGKNVQIGALLLSNIQDLLMALDIYKHSFIRDVYGVPPIGDSILEAFSNADKADLVKKPTISTVTSFIKETEGNSSGMWLTINDIRKIIKDNKNIVLPNKIVFNVCRQLVDAGYLEDIREATVTKFKVIDEIKDLQEPDVDLLIQQAGDKVKEKFPDRYDEWLSLQKQPYIHPITGEEVKL